MTMKQLDRKQLRAIATTPRPESAKARARWYWARKRLNMKTNFRKGGHAMIRAIAWSLAINLFLASFLLYLANTTPCIYTVIARCWQ